MPRLTLSDDLVASLVVINGRPHTEYFDSASPGLYVDVLTSGRKSYRLRQLSVHTSEAPPVPMMATLATETPIAQVQARLNCGCLTQGLRGGRH